MQPNLEPDLLRTFVAIAESGSFTGAADRVSRTQSAVSMQMKRLEETLKRPLFARNGRSIELTPDGETLLGHARRILRAHQEALLAFEESELRGSVTLGTPDDYASCVLPKVLARFAETNPLIHVEVVCDASPRLKRMIQNGTLDLALVTPDYAQTNATIVQREPAVWVTSAYHQAHEQEPLPLALFQAGCLLRRWAMESLSARGRAYRMAYTSISFAALLAAIQAGLAVGVLARSSVLSGLRILDEADGFPDLPNYEIAIQRIRNKRSPVLDRLEEHIIESFRSGITLTPASATSH